MKGISAIALPLLMLSSTVMGQQHPPTSDWFPDWDMVSRGWSLRPIVSYEKRTQRGRDYSISAQSIEFGANLQLNDFRVLKDINPGFSFRPGFGYTWGGSELDIKSPDGNSSAESGYNRNWFEVETNFYYHFFRHNLTFVKGKILYDETFADIDQLTLNNDFGVLLKPFWSSHVSVHYSVLTNRENSIDLETVTDYWFYQNFQLRPLKTRIQVGPGISYLTSKVLLEDIELTEKTRQSYLLARMALNVFWKLGLNARAEYTYAVSGESSVTNSYFGERPNSDLNTPQPNFNLAEDTLQTLVFFGLRNLIGGFGLGYQISQITVNATGSSDTETQTTEGFGFIYQNSW
ncbi:MAG: hypothetical protein HRU19_27070 [Pseudobacteriovorax sp.]|nr:hypothetical protein [Pseudobacteriovorax sp.]